MQNLKKHQKEKKTLFVSTPVLTALVKMSFFVHFSFLVFFLQFPIISEMFFDRKPKFKKLQNMKTTKTKNNKKKKTRYKAKINQT